MWTRFMDMSSGGSSKLDWDYIYIEAPQEQAVAEFENMFGRDPYNVTCNCCGQDYSIGESDSLENATGYERNCDAAYFDEEGNELVEYVPGSKYKYVERARRKYNYNNAQPVPLEEYAKNPGIKIVRASDLSRT